MQKDFKEKLMKVWPPRKENLKTVSALDWGVVPKRKGDLEMDPSVKICIANCGQSVTDIADNAGTKN